MQNSFSKGDSYTLYHPACLTLQILRTEKISYCWIQRMIIKMTYYEDASMSQKDEKIELRGL